jgi:hypothetical protein
MTGPALVALFFSQVAGILAACRVVGWGGGTRWSIAHGRRNSDRLSAWTIVSRLDHRSCLPSAVSSADMAGAILVPMAIGTRS